MANVYLYIVGASANPDGVDCHVPWYLGAGEVFFGPCKKDIREELRKELLRGADHALVREPIYFVGFNALGGGHVRKIVWTGRIREAMSFGRAWTTLTDAKFMKMREDESSPLHVRPLEGPSGTPRAYQIVSQEHRANAAWLADLATDRGVSRLVHSGDLARLPGNVSWWDGFGRDVCFLFEDCFVAGREGEPGIEVDDDLVEILRDAQPHRPKVDRVAVFGRNVKGDVYGRGHVLLTGEDDLAGRFLRWLDQKGSSGAPVRAATAERAAGSVARAPRRRC